MPAEFPYNLTKNLTAFLPHILCAVLPKEYEEKTNTALVELNRLREKKSEQLSRKELLVGMIREIEENDLTVTEFDEKLWRLMVESVVVDENRKMTFKFRNEMEIEV